MNRPRLIWFSLSGLRSKENAAITNVGRGFMVILVRYNEQHVCTIDRLATS